METQKLPSAWQEIARRGWTHPAQVLSVRQPWAWLIVNGHKDIENRTWSTKFRGRILIHASKSCTYPDRTSCVEYLRDIGKWNKIKPAWVEEFETGGIVGEAEIVDCVESSESLWFQGPIGFVLRNARPLPFVAGKGMLRIYNFHPELDETDKEGTIR